MTDTGSLDRIERTIDIDASADDVFELVSEPGWWINDGTVVEHDIDRAGSRAVVTDPEHGTFVLEVVQADRPTYAAFRWVTSGGEEGRRSGPDAEATAANSTLVEFFIDERQAGGVRLRVTESGFESLDRPVAERRTMFDENTEGWERELAAARDHLTGTHA